jgi:peptidoglycan/xylan/chitin deacetylase (PgdA/CDA1 family)
LTLTPPTGTRSVVCITFDFDSVAYWLGMARTLGSQGISRGEFGGRVGAERIFSLLEKYEIKSTWFTPGHTAQSWPDITQAIASAGHEIAHHGYLHEPPPELGDREEEVLLRGSAAIEDVVGVKPVGYRAPSWEITSNTIPLLLKHGFEYASNGMATDFEPYQARVDDVVSTDAPFRPGRDTSLLEIPSAWHLTDASLGFGPPSARSPALSETERVWRDEFDYMHANVENGVITYVFHPEATGRAHGVMLLERLLDHIRACDDVWFARCIDVAHAWSPDAPAGM